MGLCGYPPARRPRKTVVKGKEYYVLGKVESQEFGHGEREKDAVWMKGARSVHVSTICKQESLNGGVANKRRPDKRG